MRCEDRRWVTVAAVLACSRTHAVSVLSHSRTRFVEVSTEADRGLGTDPAATNNVQVLGEWVAACRRCLLGEPRALGCVPRSRGGLGGAARAAAQEAAGFEQGRKHIVLHPSPRAGSEALSTRFPPPVCPRLRPSPFRSKADNIWGGLVVWVCCFFLSFVPCSPSCTDLADAKWGEQRGGDFLSAAGGGEQPGLAAAAWAREARRQRQSRAGTAGTWRRLALNRLPAFGPVRAPKAPARRRRAPWARQHHPAFLPVSVCWCGADNGQAGESLAALQLPCLGVKHGRQ